MGYERYPRNDNRGEDHGGGDRQDENGGYGSRRDYGYSGARGNQTSGQYRDDASYGQRDQGGSGYERGQQSGGYGRQYGQSRESGGDEYRGAYSSGRYGAHNDRPGRDDNDRGSSRFGQDRQSGGRDRGNYGRQPQGYDYDERGFAARAGDEVRSWFGDEDAERRREADARHDERSYADRSHDDRDGDYHNWRRGQIAALDRDYDEYRSENRSKFENEFSSWRSTRQTQRNSLNQVAEHMDVVGSDGSHVGTVDKVRGDRILLTKNDAEAGGRHHSIPSRWIETVDTKVTLSKSADEAKSHWRDEERNQAMFGDESDDKGGRDAQGRMLNRSFSGTY